MIEGASLGAGKERGALPIWGTIPNDPGHTNTSTGGQQDPLPLLEPRSTPTASAGMSSIKRSRLSSIERDSTRDASMPSV